MGPDPSTTVALSVLCGLCGLRPDVRDLAKLRNNLFCRMPVCTENLKLRRRNESRRRTTRGR
jgi:hypothetical protein